MVSTPHDGQTWELTACKRSGVDRTGKRGTSIGRNSKEGCILQRIAKTQPPVGVELRVDHTGRHAIGAQIRGNRQQSERHISHVRLPAGAPDIREQRYMSHDAAPPSGVPGLITRLRTLSTPCPSSRLPIHWLKASSSNGACRLPMA